MSVKTTVSPTPIAVERIHPNTWNPNSMKPEIFEALIEDIVRNGFLGAILIRLCHCSSIGEDHYEIIDGEHRWLAAQDRRVDLKEIPCYVVERDDVSARIETVTRNREHGELVGEKLVKLIEELRVEYKLSYEDVRTRMFIQEEEFKLVLEPLQIKLDDSPTPELRGRQKKYAIHIAVASKQDYKYVTESLEKITKELECDKGYALVKVFMSYETGHKRDS